VPERLVFDRLSVFSGTFDLDAAQSVCDGEGVGRTDIWELLTSLVDKSLVEVDAARGGIRYRLLETMREYGREHLLATTEVTMAVRRRHLEHYLLVAEASDRLFTGRAGRDVGVRLTDDGENFEAALNASLKLGLAEPGLRLAVALADYWYVRALHRETVTWLTTLLAQPLPAPRPDLRGRAMLAVGRSLAHLSRLPEASALLEDALAIARAQDDDTLACQILVWQAFLTYLEGDARTMALAVEAFEVARRVGDPTLLAISLDRMADAYKTLDADRSRTLHDEALRTARRADDDTVLETVLNNSAEDARHAGDFDLARERLEECIAIAEARNDHYFLATAKLNLAAVLVRLGEVESAAPLAHDALLLAERSGSPLSLAYAILAQAAVASSAGELHRGAMLHGAADALFAEAGTSPELADGAMRDESLAALRARMGDAFEREYESGRVSGREAALAVAREPTRLGRSVTTVG
jgi:tetratricopeptide (TPR) repeat protein